MAHQRNPWVIVVCLLVMAGLFMIGSGWRSHAVSRSSWEYKIMRINLERPGEPVVTMNELGSDGWEFVQIISEEQIRGKDGQYLFKRAK